MLIKMADFFRPSHDLRFPHKGVVVDNQDPRRLGRVKVLIDGVFPALENLVPGTDVAGTGEPAITDPRYQSLPWISSWLPGPFKPPEVDDELTVVFPWEDIYFGFYTGHWESDVTHDGWFNDSYPDAYGYRDSSGTGFRIDRARRILEFLHASGLKLDIDGDGNLVVATRGRITFRSPEGETAWTLDPATGEVAAATPAAQVITSDLRLDNSRVDVATGAWEEDVDGSKQVRVGAGYKRLIGGSESVVIGSSSSRAIGGDESKLVGGKASHTYGLGFEATVVAGNYTVETLLGGIELKSLLATLKVPISGIAELDGLMVRIAGGAQPMLKGQDTVQWLMTHTHPTGVGESAPSTQAATAIQLLSLKAFNG